VPGGAREDPVRRAQEREDARLRAMNDLSTLPLTMSTLEIAGLTGKAHAHVLRDADKMLAELGIGESKFGSSYVTEQNKAVRLLNLPKRECLILSYYSVEMRADEDMR
jgi:phage regulator Rha-like protein